MTAPAFTPAAHLRAAADLLASGGWTTCEMVDASGCHCVMGAILATDSTASLSPEDLALLDGMSGPAPDAAFALRAYLRNYPEGFHYGEQYGGLYTPEFEGHAEVSERITGWNDLELPRAGRSAAPDLAIRALRQAADWHDQLLATL